MVLSFCINERVNYLAQITEFLLVQDLLAAGLPLAPSLRNWVG